MNTRRLLVVLYGREAGVLERSGGSLSFTYHDEYRTSPAATPLSLSMPLSGARYTNRIVEAFLRGLLPDNSDVRRRWSTHFGLRDRDTFGLIAAIGNDAAGGAQFISEHDDPAALTTGHVVPVTEAEIAARLRRLREDATDWLGEGEHWSLAGAQSKFTVRALTQGWGIAFGSEPSTHIIKPGISTIASQALIEHVTMRSVATLGLRAAATEYIEFEGEPAIVITRFDRRLRRGRWERIHQEDLCQSLALDPSRKYETDRGPGVARIARLLKGTAGNEAVEDFGRAVVANYVMGAPDAHAKNYSVLLAAGAVKLADLYDVASGLTAVRDGHLRYPRGAMSLGGERTFGEMRARNWSNFATSLGVSADQVRGWVTSLAERAPDAVAQVVKELVPTQRRNRALGELRSRVQVLSELTLHGLNDTTMGRNAGPTGPDLLMQGATPGRSLRR